MSVVCVVEECMWGVCVCKNVLGCVSLYVWHMCGVCVCIYMHVCGGCVADRSICICVVCVCVCILYEHVHVGVVIFSSHYVHKITKKRLMPHHFIAGCLGAMCVCGHFFPVVP